MPAPSNTTYLTAIDITSLPYTTTQDVNFGGTTYTVWYKYTAVSGDEVLGIFPFGALGVGAYSPLLFLDVEAPYVIPMAGGFSVTNRPGQFPVDVGKTYFFQIISQTGNVATANLQLNLQRFSQQTAPFGSIMIPDDTSGFPAAIISTTSGEVLRFVPGFPAGEAGAVVGSTMLVESGGTYPDYLDDGLSLYSSTFALIVNHPSNTLPPTVNQFIVGVNDKYYVGFSGGGLDPAVIKTVNATTGALGPTTWTLTQAGLTGLAVNAAETVAYIVGNGLGVIKKWDLVNDVALPNFPLPGAIYDLTMMSGDRLVVSKTTGTDEITFFVYETAGETLVDSHVVTNVDSARVKAPADGSDVMAIWFETGTPSGYSKFATLDIVTGDVVETSIRAQFEGGAYQGDATATPTDRFGHSFSCPFFLLGAASVPEDEEEPPLPTSTTCPCPDSPAGTVPEIDELVLVPDWIPSCGGGGTVPSAADLVNSEMWDPQ